MCQPLNGVSTNQDRSIDLVEVATPRGADRVRVSNQNVESLVGNVDDLTECEACFTCLR